MKQNTSPATVSPLVSRFLAYRASVRSRARNAATLALVGAATLKASSSIASIETPCQRHTSARVMSQTVRDAHREAGDADTLETASKLEMQAESIGQGRAFGATFSLTPSERAAIQAARPGSVSVVFRPSNRSNIAGEEGEPLPAGYIAASIEEAAPLIDPVLDAEVQDELLLAQLERETAANLAAQGFVSDYAPTSPESFDAYLHG